MTVYQELQLNQAGSKQLVRNSKTGKEKVRHSLIYLLKITLTLAFCIAFIGIYTVLFGRENSIVGVVVLLGIMVFRCADFSVSSGQSLGILALIYGIFIFGPQAAHYFGIFPGFLINVISIMMIMVLGCYNPLMSNQSTLVLGYLLLYGYEVSGNAYRMRMLALFLGALMTMLVFYRNHKKRVYKRQMKNIFEDFRFESLRGRWQVCMALCVPTVLMIAEYMHMPKTMWAGIAAMSVTTLFLDDMKTKVRDRIIGNTCGALAFAALSFILPEAVFANIGIIGGVGVGLSATYGWQAAFNTFGALAVASQIFGLKGAVSLRVVHNIYGAIFALIFFAVFNIVVNKVSEMKNDNNAVNCA